MADEPATSVDDVYIALLLMERDREGVRMLAQAHGPRVLGFLRKYFAAQAEDALQEALKKVLTLIDTFDDTKGNVGAWFLTIARNAALDLIDREKKHQHVDYDDAGGIADPVWAVDESEEDDEPYDPRALDKDRELLSEILGTLSPMQRQILVRDAAHRDGLVPAADLADELESTANSVRANRAKAWKAVAEQLTKRGLPPRRKT